MWFIHRTLADNNNTSEKEFCQLKSNWLQFFKPSVHIKYFIIFYLSLDLLAPRAGPELYSFSQLKMWDNIIYEHFISILFSFFFFIIYDWLTVLPFPFHSLKLILGISWYDLLIHKFLAISFCHIFYFFLLSHFMRNMNSKNSIDK